MYVEYCNYNRYIEDYDKELNAIYAAIENGLAGVAAPIHLISNIQEYIPDSITLAAPVDFPTGYSSSKVREHMILNALQSGANAIDFVPHHYFLQCKFSELFKEIDVAVTICKDHSATLRVFIDYRYIRNIVKFAHATQKMGVDLCFTVMGYHHEDFYDTLINCKLIETKTEMSTIFNGYIWKPEQIEQVKKAELFGLRLYNLDLWCKKK